MRDSTSRLEYILRGHPDCSQATADISLPGYWDSRFADYSRSPIASPPALDGLVDGTKFPGYTPFRFESGRLAALLTRLALIRNIAEQPYLAHRHEQADQAVRITIKEEF